MPIARPTSVEGVLTALAEHPDADLLAGGTDLMVAVNMGHHRPRGIVALRRVRELAEAGPRDGHLELGALTTYAQIEADLPALAPGLAMAARTVGSPQIRNAGTVGGNIATASPAGDTLPWLVAMDAEVVVAAAERGRTLPLADLLVGPKRTALRPGEVITAVRVPRVEGPQHVAKIGTRNAMVISVASVAVVVDTGARRVRVALGSVAPVPLRVPAAEEVAGDGMDWGSLTAADDVVEAFGAACAAASAPITDHRSTAEYRRHATGVLAARSLRRCLAA